jgi:hypothetical protein
MADQVNDLHPVSLLHHPPDATRVGARRVAPGGRRRPCGFERVVFGVGVNRASTKPGGIRGRPYGVNEFTPPRRIRFAATRTSQTAPRGVGISIEVVSHRLPAFSMMPTGTEAGPKVSRPLPRR